MNYYQQVIPLVCKAKLNFYVVDATDQR